MLNVGPGDRMSIELGDLVRWSPDIERDPLAVHVPTWEICRCDRRDVMLVVNPRIDAVNLRPNSYFTPESTYLTVLHSARHGLLALRSGVARKQLFHVRSHPAAPEANLKDLGKHLL